MPTILADALRDELKSRHVYEEACGPAPTDKVVHGGKGEAETVSHFTHRFKTSSARVQFVILNPNGTFDPHATELRGRLLDGKVGVLDVACGSGGRLFGLRTTIAALRTQTSSGLFPIDLHILAGDCSEEARAIHAGMSARIRPSLEAVGIRIHAEHMHWDVTQPLSTTALMDRWFEVCPDSQTYLVFISAFSGFMAKNTEVVLEAVRDIAKRFHNKPFHVAWIEPITNDSQKILPKALGALASLFGLSSKGKNAEPHEQFSYVHPFTGEIVTGRARMLPWEKVPQ